MTRVWRQWRYCPRDPNELMIYDDGHGDTCLAILILFKLPGWTPDQIYFWRFPGRCLFGVSRSALSMVWYALHVMIHMLGLSHAISWLLSVRQGATSNYAISRSLCSPSPSLAICYYSLWLTVAAVHVYAFHSGYNRKCNLFQFSIFFTTVILPTSVSRLFCQLI